MNRLFFLASVVCILCQVFHVEAFMSRGLVSRKFQTKTSTLVSAKPGDKAETDDEIRERLRQKVRKNLYSDKGVAYAPWVTNQIDEDVSPCIIEILTYIRLNIDICIPLSKFIVLVRLYFYSSILIQLL